MDSSYIANTLFNTAIVGEDDGFDSHKTTVMYRGVIERIRIPSFIALGPPKMAALDGTEEAQFGYKTEDAEGMQRTYHVGDAITGTIETAKRGFPTSPEARVLFHHAVRHALSRVGYNGTDPVVCFSGLPVQTYYIHDARNEPVISAKLGNLDPRKPGYRPVQPMGQSLGPMPNFAYIGCSAEAISAYFAYTRRIDPNDFTLTVDQHRSAARVIVVDFGGRTIDIVPINAGKPVFASLTSIHDKGTIHLTRLLERAIKTKRQDIEYLERLGYPEFRNAMMTGKLKIFSEEIDVSAERDLALADYRDEVGQQLQQILEGLVDFESVLFVGGPTELLVKSGIGRWAPRQLKRLQLDERDDLAFSDAAFMNSDGLCVQALYAARALAESQAKAMEATN